MKKLVLVMVCTMLLGMFVAFNYLLWDRQNKVQDIKALESSKASKNASINVLAKEVDRLEEENRKYADSINTMENRKKLLQYENEDLIEKSKQQINDISSKAITIEALLELTDTSIIQEVIKNWFGALKSKDYKIAHNIFPKDFSKSSIVLDEQAFERIWTQNLKDIKLKKVVLVKNEQKSVEEHGAILFLVIFDIKLTKDADPLKLDITDGDNFKLFKMDYNINEKLWKIKEILYSDGSTTE